MELLDIYDSEGKKTGKTIERGNKNFGENEFIKLTTIWIKCKDKYLIQKCSHEKGDEYAVSGGHVQSGKTSTEQIILEAEEELGLKITPEALEFLGTIKKTHAIFDVFSITNDKLINHKFSLQEEEVSQVLWLTKE